MISVHLDEYGGVHRGLRSDGDDTGDDHDGRDVRDVSIVLVVFVVVVAIVPEARQPSVIDPQRTSSQVSIFWAEGKKDGALNKHLPTPKGIQSRSTEISLGVGNWLLGVSSVVSLSRPRLFSQQPLVEPADDVLEAFDAVPGFPRA